MKRLLLGSASVVAVMLGLSGAANAQVLDDLGALGEGIGAIVGAGIDIGDVTGIDIGALNGIGDSLPANAGEGGIYLNTAVNVAPQLATNVNIAPPLSVGDAGSGLGGLVAAVGAAFSPETGSIAGAIDTTGIAGIIAAVGSNINTGDQAATAVGVLANQATQNASTAVASLDDESVITYDGGTFDASDEATQAAAQAGNAASNAAARYAEVSITGPTLNINNNILDTSSDGALQGVYAANTALNLAPQIAANINSATNITTGDLSATAVGVLANQSISIGLDGAALSGSLTGNFAGGAAGGDE